MSAQSERVLDWFERSGSTYWKLFPAGNREMLARYWPAKETEEGSTSETPENGLAALDTEIQTLEPGKYMVKACHSAKAKDTSNHFHLTFTIPKNGTETEPAARVQGQPNPLGFAQTGIFGHPDVQAHLKQMEAMAELKLQLAILQLQMKNGGAAEAPPSPMEKAIAAFVGNLAPHAPALVAAFHGGQVPPVAATPQTPAAPVAGANDEATIVENSLIRIKAADPDYFTKLQALANYAEKNPEGFKSILGSVSLLQ